MLLITRIQTNIYFSFTTTNLKYINKNGNSGNSLIPVWLIELIVWFLSDRTHSVISVWLIELIVCWWSSVTCAISLRHCPKLVLWTHSVYSVFSIILIVIIHVLTIRSWWVEPIIIKKSNWMTWKQKLSFCIKLQSRPPTIRLPIITNVAVASFPFASSARNIGFIVTDDMTLDKEAAYTPTQLTNLRKYTTLLHAWC